MSQTEAQETLTPEMITKIQREVMFTQYMMAASCLLFAILLSLVIAYFFMGSFVNKSEDFSAAYQADPDAFEVVEIPAADLALLDANIVMEASSGVIVRASREGKVFEDDLPTIACITDADGVRPFVTSDRRQSDGSISLIGNTFGRDTVAPLVDAGICQKAIASAAP